MKDKTEIQKISKLIDLLPCPFCGGIPFFDTTKHSVYVRCKCGAKGKYIRQGDGTPGSKYKLAAKFWNTRIN